VNGVAQPLTTIYEYDADGALQLVKYPTGLAVRYDRDPMTGQVTAVRNAADGTPWASGVTHYPTGPVASLTFGNGRTLAQGYDLLYQPTWIESGPLSLALQASPAGDIAVVSDRSQDLDCTRSVDRTLRYDFLGRLSGWSDAVQGGVGVCPAEGLGPLSAAYPYVAGTDQIAGQQSPDLAGPMVYAFGYDGQKNVSAIWRYDGTGTSVTAAVCLRHDALGRLVMVGPTGSGAAPGGTACVSDAEVTGALARFKYDAMSRRVARQVNGQWTYVVSDRSGNPLSELALTGDAVNPWAKVRDYVWLDGRLLAQVEYGPSGGRSYYAHLDHLGTPRALTSPSGQLVWSTFQRPYGEVGEKTVPDAVTGQTVVTNLRLPGQYDERLFAAAGISGLPGPYYNWNRWYLPSVGRYLELDPIAKAGGFNGFYGPNWYGYAEGNPLRWRDRKGLAVYMCEQPADTMFNFFGVPHKWIMTDSGEAGLGPCGGGVPGEDGGPPDLPFIQTCNNDHEGRWLTEGANCETVPGVDEACVNSQILQCKRAGRWMPGNTCWSYAEKTLDRCRVASYPEPNMCQ
jgi:RHS repeat-associated protein